MLRRLAGWLAVALLAIACRRREEVAPVIHADDAAAPRAQDAAAPPADRIVVRRVDFVSEGPFELRLAYPHVDLPSGAGAKISSTLEDDLRRHAKDLRDRWTSTPRVSGSTGWYRMTCVPAVVAHDVVAVDCRGALDDGKPAMEVKSYVWIVDETGARLLSIDDVVAPTKMTVLATHASAQITRAIGKSGVLSPADLVARRAFDRWSVRREGLAFDFLPGEVSPVMDELYAAIDWTKLLTISRDDAMVKRMQAAVAAPDTLFGYPADAGP